MCYYLYMNIIKVVNSSGRDIYLNLDNVCYVFKDLMSPDTVTQVQTAKDNIAIKMPLSQVIELFEQSNKGKK